MKITKSQLRRIIKEEVQKTMDEGFLDKVGDTIHKGVHKGKEAFKSAVGVQTDAQKKAKKIIRRRADYLTFEMLMDPTEAETQAAAEYKAGKLDDRGAPKSGLEKSMAAGVKDNPYGEKKPGRHWSGRKLTDKEAQNRNRAFADTLRR